MDPFTSKAAAMRGSSPHQAMVTNCKVSGEKGLLRAGSSGGGRGAGCGSPAVSSKRGPQQLWLSGEAQRPVWAEKKRGLWAHTATQSNLKTQVALFVFISTFLERNVYFLGFITGGIKLAVLSCFPRTLGFLFFSTFLQPKAVS